MGQAKRRGTPADRKQQAQKGQGGPAAAATMGQALFDAIAGGQVQHYAFIFDRSERGRLGMRALSEAPGELGARFKSSSFHQVFWLWNEDAFPFVAIWGTFGYTGGLTIPAVIEQALLDEALPRIVERNAEKGGLCAYILAVDPGLQERLGARLRELEAQHGLQQASLIPLVDALSPTAAETDPSARGLLDLALAQTGREIDMNRVQILDQKAFGEIASSMMLLASQSLSKNKALREKDLALQGWEQDDGRLVVHAPIPGEKYKVITIASGGWKELGTRDADALLEQLETQHAEQPAEREALLDALAGQMQHNSNAWQQARKEFEELDPDKTGMLVACTKAPTALARLRDITEHTQEWLPHVETWLASDDEVLVLHTRPEAPSATLYRLERQEDLITGFLEHAAAQIGSKVESTLVVFAEVREDIAEAARQRWRELGGKA